MNEATASVLRTAVKCAAVIILLNGWPKFRKAPIFNQTVIQPSQADDLVMRSVILELSDKQPHDDFVAFRRVVEDEDGFGVATDVYSMDRTAWEADGSPDQISITVSNLVAGKSV